MASGAERTTNSMRPMSATSPTEPGEIARVPQLDGRKAKFGPGNQTPLNQSFRDACAARYGRSFEEWLPQTQKDRLNGAELNSEQTHEIEQTLKANTPLKAARWFLDSFITADGVFCDAPFAQECMLSAINHHRDLEGEPPCQEVPAEHHALMLTPEVGRCVRDALLARPWLVKPLPAEGGTVGATAGGVGAPAGLSSKGTPDLEDARRRLAKILIHALTTRYGQVGEAEPYFAAIDRLGLAPAEATQLKCDLLDRADYREQRLVFERLFTGGEEPGGSLSQPGVSTAWSPVNLLDGTRKAVGASGLAASIGAIEGSLKQLADPTLNDERAVVLAGALIETLTTYGDQVMLSALGTSDSLWELTRSAAEFVGQNPALGRALIRGAIDSAVG